MNIQIENVKTKEEIIYLLKELKKLATKERKNWLKDKEQNTLDKCVKLEEKFELLCWVLNKPAQEVWDNL